MLKSLLMLGQRDATVTDMNYRHFGVRASSVNTDERTIEAMISTENPVPMIDWERWEMVPEVLLTSGCEFPKSRQVPLLDSHARYSTQNQLGSIRNLNKEASGIAGVLHFSAVAEDEWTKVREGHVTDVSAGYQVLKRTYVPDGKTKSFGDREFTGPVNVVTKWRLNEGSITPIGADQQAKMRGFDPAQLPPLDPEHSDLDHTPEGMLMNPELRKLLESRGMPAGLDDSAANKWYQENAVRLLTLEVPANPTNPTNPDPSTNPQTDPGRSAPTNPPHNPTGNPGNSHSSDIAAAVRAALLEQEQQRAAFRSDVDSLCELADLTDLRERCYGLADVAAVRTLLQEQRRERASQIPSAPRISITGEGRDRFRADAQAALTLRCLENTGSSAAAIERAMPVANRPRGWETFRHATLLDLARECLHADGFDTRGLTRESIAIAALGWPGKVGLRSSPGYHTTGSFLLLTQDAVNKSMMIGYVEAPSTWQGPMRQAASTPDFKQIHRLRLGAVPNLPIWPDNDKPAGASFAEAQEQYGVEARSLQISLSWRLLVNDDMDVLSRAPAMLGAAAKRTVNAVAWAQVTSNPTLSDGQTLFLETPTGNRKRSNYTVGAAAPSVTTVGGMTAKMRLMRGENTPEGNESQDVLNLEPAYIVGPATQETTILQLVNSIADPAAGGNSAVHNPTRRLTPLIEPLLDSDSTTAYYLFASPAQVDTVEVTFLQGQETPVTRDWMDEETLSQNWAILQTFAAKAMNHRGIQKHKGAA